MRCDIGSQCSVSRSVGVMWSVFMIRVQAENLMLKLHFNIRCTLQFFGGRNVWLIVYKMW